MTDEERQQRLNDAAVLFFLLLGIVLLPWVVGMAFGLAWGLFFLALFFIVAMAAILA